MANRNDDGLSKKQLLEDEQSYPILTREIGGRAPYLSTPGTASTPGASQLGQVVDGALREVLGWRPRETDVQGFVGALNQSFSIKEVEGHTEWKWTPRSYAVAAEMGAVTGAQASMYTRAKAMLDQSLPLLEGLQPLNPAFDLEDSEAIRAIVRSSMTELVAELGREGGPRVARVDELLYLLLGKNDNFTDTEKVEGQLGLLRDRFGLRQQFVNTIGEEQNLTNFLILVDNSSSLSQTWRSQRHFFDLRGNDVFLGTQMVLLSRALAVVAESVEEVYFVMDSVFLGAAERQVTEIRFDHSPHDPTPRLPSIFLGDLLSWVERFALEEGPRLLREGGKDGVITAFSPTARKLLQLSEATEHLSKSKSSNPTRAFHSQRVQRALAELTGQLREVDRLAGQIRRVPMPKPIVVTPTEVAANRETIVRLSIEGDHFQTNVHGTKVKLDLDGTGGQEIWGTAVNVVSENLINATFDLSDEKKAPAGSYTIVVINPDGGNGSRDDVFQIRRNTNVRSTIQTSLPIPNGQHGSRGTKAAAKGRH